MKRCLIAEHSEVIRKVARAFLEDAGLEVLEAENAETALALCRQKSPDVVLLDWHLPGMTTLEFLSALRFFGPTRKPAVIYFTTENDDADISRAFSAGADTFMMKPFDRRDILEKFAELGFAA